MGGHWGPHFSLGGRGSPLPLRRTAPDMLCVFVYFAFNAIYHTLVNKDEYINTNLLINQLHWIIYIVFVYVHVHVVQKKTRCTLRFDSWPNAFPHEIHSYWIRPSLRRSGYGSDL